MHCSLEIEKMVVQVFILSSMLSICLEIVAQFNVIRCRSFMFFVIHILFIGN